MKLRTLSALALAVAVALSGCSRPALDDPATVKEQTTTQASKLGLTKVAVLRISTGSKGGDSGTLAMLKDDGTTSVVGLEGDEASLLRSTATPGLDLASVPYDDLVSVLAAAKAACDQYAGAEVFAGMSGKPFISGDCLDDKAAKAQKIDGNDLAQLPDLSSAASLDTALADMIALVGENATSFSLRYNVTSGEAPQMSATSQAKEVGGTPCTATVKRHKTWVQFEPACTEAPTLPQKLNLKELSGAKLEKALNQGMKEVGVSSPDELKTAEVLHSESGVLVLQVLADGSSKMANIPLG